MVKLPGFENRRSLEVPNAVTVSSNAFGAGIATSLGKFGNTLASVAADISERSAQAKTLDERAETLRFESEALDVKSRLDAAERESQLNYTNSPDGRGHFENMSKTVDGELNELAARYKTSSKAEEYTLKSKKIKSDYLDRAADQEYRSSVKAVENVSDRKVADLAATVQTNPDNFAVASAELDGFVSNLVLPSGAKDYLKRNLYAKLEKAKLAGDIERDAEGTVAKLDRYFQGGLKNDTGTATTKEGAPTVLSVITREAQRNGVDPVFMAGVASLESGFDINATGKTAAQPNNTAKGVFQLPDATARGFGVDPKDTPAVAAVMGKYFAINKARIEKSGRQVSPGLMYLSHMLGEPVFMQLIKAGDDAPTAAVMRSRWSENFTRSAINGNPAFFRNGRGSTVGDLIARADELMAYNMKKVAGNFNGVTASVTDNGASIAKELLGTDAKGITFADIRETYDAAKAVLKRQNAGKPDLTLGVALIEGRTVFDPSDSVSKNAIDGVFMPSQVTQRFLSGDPETAGQLNGVVTNLNYIPKPIVQALRIAVEQGDEHQKVRAFEFIASADRDNNLAVKQSQLDADTLKKARTYSALTTQQGLSSNEAIKRIKVMGTPEYAKKLEGLKDSGVLKEWTKRLSFDDVVGEGQDQSWFSDPAAMTTGQQDAILSSFRDAFEFHAADVGEEQTALALAKQDMGRTFGVSRIFGGQRFTAFPVEKFVPKVEGSHDWIVQQAQEQIRRDNGTDVAASNVFLIPTSITQEAIASKRPPKYELAYRDENGILQRSRDLHFAPDVTKACAEKANAHEASGLWARTKELLLKPLPNDAVIPLIGP